MACEICSSSHETRTHLEQAELESLVPVTPYNSEPWLARMTRLIHLMVSATTPEK